VELAVHPLPAEESEQDADEHLQAVPEVLAPVLVVLAALTGILPTAIVRHGTPPRAVSDAREIVHFFTHFASPLHTVAPGGADSVLRTRKTVKEARWEVVE
jgi:hypothetical protein